MRTREASRANGNGARLREIVEAAAAAFHDHGYEATSMQDIADRVGMLKGSLYHHISSKEELLAAVLRDTQAGGLEIVERHRAAEGSCRDRLRSFVEEYTLYCIDNRMRAAIFDREFRSLTPARPAHRPRAGAAPAAARPRTTGGASPTAGCADSGAAAAALRAPGACASCARCR